MADTYTKASRRSTVSPARLCKRYDELHSQAGTYRSHCRDVAAVLLPNYKLSINTEALTEGQEAMDEVLDSTGMEALKLLSATMAGTLTPSEIDWFALKLRDDELNRDKSVQDWLEDVRDRMSLALRQSNFYAEVGGAYRQLAGFGQFALFVDERKDGGGLVFHTYAIGHYVQAEDEEGRVDTVFREYKLSARVAVDLWGKERVGEKINGLLEQNKGDEKVTILHAIYPRKVRNPKNATSLHMPYVCAYIHKEAKHLILESGYHEMPVMVPRWEKMPGEVYGRGPGMTALPDVRTLNEAVALVLRSGQIALGPPGLVSNDAGVAEIDMRPLAQTPVEGDPRVAWVPLESGAKFDVGQILTEQLRERIRHIFYWEQLQLQGNKIMTAFEVEQRLDLMRRILGPELSRFQYEFLTHLINRVYGIMARAGEFPPSPRILLDAFGDSANIDIEYEGPLARSQKMGQIQAIDLMVDFAIRLAQVSPEASLEALDWINIDDTMQVRAHVTGADPAVLRSREEVMRRRQQRQQQAAQQAQLNQIEQAATAAGRAAPALTALQDAAGMMNGGSQTTRAA